MKLKTTFVAMMMACAGSAMGQSVEVRPSSTPLDQRPTARPDGKPSDVLPFLQIEPRKPLRKLADEKLQFNEHTSGRLIVKFKDESLVRVNAVQGLTSHARADLRPLQRILDQFDVRVEPVFQKSEDRLKVLQDRAAMRTHQGQPDLAGMMYLTSDSPVKLEQAARALNALDVVEFIEMERIYAPAQAGPGACCVPLGGGGSQCVVIQQASCEAAGGYWIGSAACDANALMLCSDAGACCVGDGECEFLPVDLCADAGTNYAGAGILCSDPSLSCDDPDCGVLGTGDCFVANGNLYCEDFFCCNFVCELDPFCCEEGATVPPGRPGPPQWDIQCATLALQLCPGGNPCTPFAGNCFEAHPGAGCSSAGCCTAVCSTPGFEFCCQTEWDALCVQKALELCNVPGPGPTPSFTDAQGYLTAASYLGSVGFLPPEIAGCVFTSGGGIPVRGYGGQGMDLDALTALADYLISQYGIGASVGNLARGGATIRVGVIEHSCNPNHEELRDKLNVEPGQTILQIPGSQNVSGDHGTACLGIIGAQDDGSHGPGPDERGIVGIAPEAELWFFPIVSAEQPGGRLLDAMASAMEIFEPGDVLSFSIGPGGCGTLASQAAPFAMLSLARDLGITCCIAAGNSCCNLDDAGQFDEGDSGCTIVAASEPGSPFCRLGFSNHCQGCSADTVTHASAWGTCVMTIGYGDVFFPNANRKYTGTFGGTSAACPQVAGLAARLQGLAKMFYGLPLTPTQLRQSLGVGFPQCLIPNEVNRPGATAPFECLGDHNFEEEPNIIGPYPRPFQAADSMISSSFFDGNPHLQDIYLVKGKHVFGNRVSVLATDGSYFVATSEFTERRRGGGNPGLNAPSFVGSAATATYYLAAGQVVDVIVVSRIHNVFASQIIVGATLKSPPATSGGATAGDGLVFIDLWDWRAGRWTLVNFGTLPLNQGTDFNFNSTVFGAQRFIGQNGVTLGRLHVMVPGGQSAATNSGDDRGASQFPLLIDRIAIDSDETFSFPVPIGGIGGGGGGGGNMGP